MPRCSGRDLRLFAGGDETETDIQALLLAKIAVAPIPLTALEIAAELAQAAVDVVPVLHVKNARRRPSGRRREPSSLRDHQPQRPVEALLLPQVTVLGVPVTGVEGGGEAPDDALLDRGLEQRPHRLRGADGGVEERFGAGPESLEEAVGAVGGSGDVLDPGPAAESPLDLRGRGKAGELQLDALGEELQLPGGQVLEVEGEDDDRAAGDAAQLGEASLRWLPVVDGHAGHRGVEAAV